MDILLIFLGWLIVIVGSILLVRNGVRGGELEAQAQARETRKDGEE